jgi:hypothetical protein
MSPRLIDYTSREPEDLAEMFNFWGRVDAPSVEGKLYSELAFEIARDPELLALAAERQGNQPPPNMLFAAVQYLLLGGVEHELREHYPILAGGAKPKTPAFPKFRDFCLTHRDEILHLVRTRWTQTCVLRRCVCLLPSFAHVFSHSGRALALMEVGPSAGLNLLWDRYRYDYRGGPSWGDPDSALLLDTEKRGRTPLPELPDSIEVAWRMGVDLHPVDITDDDQVRWLRALIFPEHVERHAQMAAAIRIGRAHPPHLVEGDAVERLPELLEQAPRDAALVVFATVTLYQFPRDAVRSFFKLLVSHGEQRPLFFLSMESTGVGGAELLLTHYVGGARDTLKLGECHPHGQWIEWIDA